MKKLAIFFAGLLLGCIAIHAQQIKDPNVQLRGGLKGFHAVKLSSAFDVFLTQAATEEVAVSASDPKYLDAIRVEVKDGVLYVDYDGKGKWSMGNKKLKAYISFKQLDKLDAGGACDIDIVGEWKADEASIHLSGASDLQGKISAKKLSLDLSGASDMHLSGSAVQLDIDASGASKFQGLELAADYCNAKASGASAIRININKEMSVHASGASDIDYKGNGVIKDLKTSGASSIAKVGS